VTCTKCHERPAKRLLIFAAGKHIGEQPEPAPRCNGCTAEEFAEQVGDDPQKAAATYSLRPEDGSRMMNDWYLQRLIQPVLRKAAGSPS
jgi:hypothetical protein